LTLKLTLLTSAVLFGLSVAKAQVPASGRPQQIPEQRLRLVEDKLAIYELIAAVPPSADTASGFALDRIYSKDATFSRSENLGGASGREAVKELIERPAHHQAIEGGLAHFAGLPLIELRGNEAWVTSYLQLISPDPRGLPYELPNHGVSSGYRIHRVLANRWHLVRAPEGWRITSRVAIPLDGTPPAPKLLSQGLERFRLP
jgi:SnoaL-like domain